MPCGRARSSHMPPGLSAGRSRVDVRSLSPGESGLGGRGWMCALCPRGNQGWEVAGGCELCPGGNRGWEAAGGCALSVPRGNRGWEV
ncbi:hypothetical protein ANANG_G00230750 [Anguilla anguilla]|uniref:Uncharacterized protein n=1 Tax=Anguilla anguilla TaxID=7936 RepID=A0A9D3LXF5_ANGAN|nr:hypothetical protein ANANG_G00230750 [Anguilla anguilla]